MGNSQSFEKDTVTNTQPPATLPSQEHVDPQAMGGSEKDPNAQQPARKAEEEEEEEEKEAREKAGSEGVTTAAPRPHFQTSYKEIQKDDGMYTSTSTAVSGRGVGRDPTPPLLQPWVLGIISIVQGLSEVL